MRLPLPFLTLAAAALLGFGGTASGQMVLPGAVAPTPEGAPAAPAARPAPRPQKPRPVSGPRREGAPAPANAAAPSPAMASLAGQTLFLNGRKSQITFAVAGGASAAANGAPAAGAKAPAGGDKTPAGRDRGLEVSRLTLVGTRPANTHEDCQVDLSSPPIAVADLGRPNGLARIRLALPACPIVFDVLDGAALAVGDPPSCDFSEKACRVNPAGLWGAQPGAIGPDKVKLIERARAQAEAAVRADFKRLLTTTRDKPTISAYAREQAGFSSAREEICRDYAGEGRHGFCATRLTQARAAALRAKADSEGAAKAQRKKDRSNR